MRETRWAARLQAGHWVPLAALALAGTLFLSGLTAQSAKPTEYQVKAAYLYNFARFVVWPPRPAAEGKPFAMCVLGQDPFGAALDVTLAGEIIDGAPVVAVRVPKPSDAGGCRVLYISASENGRVREILAALDTASVLTVSDIPEFSQCGGMIRFVLDGNRVRFEVNLAAAKRVGLNLSSELLKLAVAVRRTP